MSSYQSNFALVVCDHTEGEVVGERTPPSPICLRQIHNQRSSEATTEHRFR